MGHPFIASPFGSSKGHGSKRNTWHQLARGSKISILHFLFLNILSVYSNEGGTFFIKRQFYLYYSFHSHVQSSSVFNINHANQFLTHSILCGYSMITLMVCQFSALSWPWMPIILFTLCNQLLDLFHLMQERAATRLVFPAFWHLSWLLFHVVSNNIDSHTQLKV